MTIVLPVTALYAGLMALLLLVLSIRVSQTRGKLGISLGGGGDAVMERRIRAQANLIEYAPCWNSPASRSGCYIWLVRRWRSAGCHMASPWVSTSRHPLPVLSA